MESEKETVAEILREMRIFKCRNLATLELEDCGTTQTYFANRIEAAHEREIAAKDAEIAELQRRLKVAEDALKPWPSLAEWLVENSTKLGISDMVSKLRERSEEAKNAIAAISGEGGNDEQH